MPRISSFSLKHSSKFKILEGGGGGLGGWGDSLDFDVVILAVQRCVGMAKVI